MATTTSSTPQRTFKTDPNSPLWKYVKIIDQVKGGGTFLWICNFCSTKKTSSYSRVKAHFCAIPQQGIKPCLGKNGNGMSPQEIAGYIREQEEADARVGRASNHPLLTGRGSKSKRPPTSPSYSDFPDIVVESHPFLDPISEEPVIVKRSKGPLERAFKNDAREIADQSVGRCLYANGLSFNVVRSPYWQDMLKKVNEAPQGYIGPGYEKVRSTLLAKEVKNIDNALAPIRNSWKQTGVSIISDGWKDTKNRPLINVIAVCPKGAMFLKAVDCEGQMKDAQFIANILIQCIQDVGPQNVVQVITDNAKNCRAAGMLIETRFEHIFWTPCAVHSLNLMLQKIGRKIDWIKQIYVEAEEIQMFITNHNMSQAIFRSFSQLELLKVAETRFASNTIVLRRLVKVRQPLASMVISQSWSLWRQSNTERAANVKRMILDDTWWDRVEYLLSFTEPIMSMIRYTDMDHPCLGEVYDGIDSMIEKMKAIINAKEQDPEETFFKEVQSICVERWNKMTTPLHLLAFALTPKFYSDEMLAKPSRVPPYRDSEVSEGCRTALTKLFPDSEMEDLMTSEFADFVASNGQSVSALRDKYKKDSHAWWYLNGHTSPNLQTLAIKVLSQVASSSSSERNWSTYSFIHSVKRNRLAASKAEELVYVHSNLRLLTHKQNEYKDGSTKFWDVDPERTDLDFSAATQSLLSGESDSQCAASASGSEAACGSSTLPTSSNVNDDVDLDLPSDPYDAIADY
ncbi:uncharacterized protein LOC131042228 [Cryptomeria japonica]|uniref:uncharacterized protein LOC131042228 n=1 Tax=Cryptomeria japonica TaxID=3369 RepID=UPI0025AC97F7|nr:uncharacterized protein LOC131042228 [Cryptomeria japonica]